MDFVNTIGLIQADNVHGSIDKKMKLGIDTSCIVEERIGPLEAKSIRLMIHSFLPAVHSLLAALLVIRQKVA